MKKKNAKFIKYLNGIILLLFFIFLTIYVFEKTGYYEYELHKQTVLTNEAIKQFEEDIRSGKNVKVEDYLTNRQMNYSNSIANLGYNISNYFGNTTRNIIKGTFEALGKWMDT